MNAFSAEEARHFTERWLPAWTGNNPELLASFYSEDVVGVCFVQLDGEGKIRRNEVYFDRPRLLAEIEQARSDGNQDGVPCNLL
jgi:hypothetical protein